LHHDNKCQQAGRSLQKTPTVVSSDIVIDYLIVVRIGEGIGGIHNVPRLWRVVSGVYKWAGKYAHARASFAAHYVAGVQSVSIREEELLSLEELKKMH
jgi:hypothetical protein